MNPLRILSWLLVPALWIAIPPASPARAEGTSFLEFLTCVELEPMRGVRSLVATRDGAYLYAASWRRDNLSIFHREPGGGLRLLDTRPHRLLNGVNMIQLTTDEKRLAAISLRNNSVVLYGRDQATGLLKADGYGRSKIDWPSACCFSPDGQFLYVGAAGAAGTSPEAKSAIVVFRIRPTGGLQEAQRFTAPQVFGMYGITCDPAGQNVYVPCSTAGNLTVLRRDGKTGLLEIQQIVEDERDGVKGLAGVVSALVSPDGTRVYTVAGRFRGDNAVSLFERAQDGSLSLLDQALEIPGFVGGNHLVVTADGSRIIASASKSGALALLASDAERRTLEHLTTVTERHVPDLEGRPLSEQVNLLGVSGLALSQDDTTLYAAAEVGGAINVFRLTPPAPKGPRQP